MIKIPVLQKEQVEKIHEASLQVLSQTGIVLGHPEARDLLSANGAKFDINRTLLPTDLVKKCLHQIPTTIFLQGRDSQKRIILRSGSFFAHNVGGVPNIYSATESLRQPAVRTDNMAATRLLDALPNVASITPLFTPQDVPGSEMTLWMTYDALTNTTKPFRTPGVQTGLEVRAISELFKIACPDGIATVGVSPVSPLTFPNHIVDAIFEVSRQGLVLGPLPCPILGATAPMSITGGLVQQNAEILASMVLAYLVKPGLPIIYKGRLSVMDPYTGLSVWGNPEIGLISAASVELAHFYGMPVDVYGLSTNAHIMDIQNGYERAINALMPVLAGADEISGVGEMEGGLSSSLAQIVLDNEILSSIHRIQNSFSIDSDSLAIDVISKVMRGSHNFLAEKHTIKYLHQGEVFNPQLAVRDSWSQWEKGGRRSMIEDAAKMADRIIS